MKVLHHHCYLDDFLKLFRAVFNDCVSSFASAKIWLCDWKNKLTLREKFPDTEFFLVRIFPHLDWIGRDTPNAGKYGPEKNSVFRHFSRSVILKFKRWVKISYDACLNFWISVSQWKPCNQQIKQYNPFVPIRNWRFMFFSATWSRQDKTEDQDRTEDDTRVFYYRLL